MSSHTQLSSGQIVANTARPLPSKAQSDPKGTGYDIPAALIDTLYLTCDSHTGSLIIYEHLTGMSV